MSDQKRWWKLWHSALSDDAVIALPAAIRWAWAALGAHTKVHGTRGKVAISPGNVVLAAQMGVSVPDLRTVIETLPHVTVRCAECTATTCGKECKNRHGEFTVTWHNWTYFQEDSTQAERQKASRSKRRGEEKRGEESSTHASNGFSTWPSELAPIRELIVGPKAMPCLAACAHWLSDLEWWQGMKVLYAPRPLEGLLRDAAGFLQSDGYTPKSKKAIRQKLRNCLEVAGRKAERNPVPIRAERVYPML